MRVRVNTSNILNQCRCCASSASCRFTLALSSVIFSHDSLLESRNSHSRAILSHCQGNNWINLQLFSISEEQTEIRHLPGGNNLTLMTENMMLNQRCDSSTHHCSLSPSFVHQSLNIRVLCAAPLNIQFSTIEEAFFVYRV